MSSSGGAFTVSGFNKKDVYQMLCKTIRAGEIETACYMSAELVCTRGELPSLCSALVDTFCSSFSGACIKDYRVITELARHLSSAVKTTTSCSSSRRRAKPHHAVEEGNHAICSNENTRTGICAAVVMLCTCCDSDDSAREEDEERRRSRKKRVQRELLVADIRPGVGDGNADKLTRAFAPTKLCGSVLKTFSYLYAACAKNDTHRALDIVDFIANDLPKDETQNITDAILYPEISAVSAKQRADVVWYLWRLCLLITDSDRRAFVEASLELFRLGYRKQARKPRLPLLLASFEIAVEGVSLDDGQAALLRHSRMEKATRLACMSIHVVYDDILASASVVENRRKEEENEKQLTVIVNKVGDNTNTKLPRDDDCMDDDNTEHDIVAVAEAELERPRNLERDLECMFFYAPIDFWSEHLVRMEIQEAQRREHALKKVRVRRHLLGSSSCGDAASAATTTAFPAHKLLVRKS